VILIDQQTTYGEENVRQSLTAHFEKQLEKSVHKTYIFQYVLDNLFDCFDVKLKIYLSELFDDDTDEFIGNKFGMQLACKLFVVASTKTRKKIIKKMKDRIEELVKNEFSLVFLIKILLFCDDTKMVGKYILKPLQHLINEEFLVNKGIFNIVMNLLVPFNKRANNANEQKILEYSVDSSSKKEMPKRQDELLFSLFDDLLNLLKSSLSVIISDNTHSTFLIDFLSFLDQRNNIAAIDDILKNVSTLIDDDYKKNGAQGILSNNGHFTIIKIIKKIIKDFSNKNIDFVKSIADILRLSLAEFLDTKAIFIIVNIIENSLTKKLLYDDVKKFKALISKKAENEKLTGYNILANHINK